MSGLSLLWIALGGALGSVARALAGWALPSTFLPWGTIAVNVAGCGIIGWLLGGPAGVAGPDSRIHAFAVVGVCGGFTTFSAFSWQTFERMQRGEWIGAAANVLLSVVVCLIATWLGWRLAR